MRKILVLIFLLVSFAGIGQVIQFPNTYGIGQKRTGGDSLLWIPSDTLTPPTSVIGRAHLANKGGTLYYWTGEVWAAVAGGVATDTTSLSNRINLKADKATTLTINGVTYDLSANRSWTVSGGASSDSTLQQITENGDSTTYRVISNDTLKGSDGYIHSSQYIGDTTFSTLDTAYYWGTSITAGSGLSSASTEGYPALSSKEYGWITSNHGTGGASINTLITELPLLPSFSSSRRKIIFEYGMNDASALDTTNFKIKYQRAIDTCIARGWSTDDLIILSPSFTEKSTLPYITQYVTASHTIANDNNIQWVNTYSFMQVRGGTALLQDSIHPTAFGHYIMWQAITHGLTGIKKVGLLDLRGTARLRGVTWVGVPGDEYPTNPSYYPPYRSILNVNGRSFYANKLYLQDSTDYSSWINIGLSSGEIGITAFDLGRNSQVSIKGKEILMYDWANAQYLTIAPTSFTLPTGGMDFQYGSNSHLKVSSNSEVVVNDNSLAIDFRVEGDNNANLIKADGTNDRVGIKNSAPDSTLDVTGSFRTTGGVRHQNLPTSTPAFLAMLDANGTMYRVDTTGKLGGGGGGGYSNLTQFVGQNNWKLFYSDGSGDVQELALGTSGQYLKSAGASSVPTWDVPSVAGIEKGVTAISSNATRRVLYDSSAILSSNENFLYNANGELQVGSPTDAGAYKLQVTGDAFLNGNSLKFTTGANTRIDYDANAFYIFANQDVYLGTSAGTYGMRVNAGAVNIGSNAVPTSTLVSAGSFAAAYVSKSADYTATVSDYTIEVTATGKTITLPTAVGITGRQYTVTYTGSSGSSTIATTSSQTFTNITATPTTLTLSALGAGAITSYTVTSNGSNWLVTGKVKNE